jgi:hypothetical protein
MALENAFRTVMGKDQATKYSGVTLPEHVVHPTVADFERAVESDGTRIRGWCP